MVTLVSDIKLMQSQILSDDDTGGGGISAQEVVNGEINNLYPNITPLDRTIGRVSLRKSFLTIDNQSTDPYYSVHVIISEPHSDTGVDILMMTTDDSNDRRLAAQDEIQSPIDIGDSFQSLWSVAEKGPLLNNIKLRLTTAGRYVAQLFPWGSSPSEVRINGDFYNGSIDYPENRSTNEYKLTLSTPLLANVAANTDVFSVSFESGWKTELSALSGATVIYLKPSLYTPGIGEFVVLGGKVLLVQSIDDSVWYEPLYAFTSDIPESVSISDVVSVLNEAQNDSNNDYFGVTKLSNNALATDNVIVVNELDKFIFPLGSENVDPQLVGLDSSSLPPSKRVKIIRQAYVIIIHNTQTESIPSPVTLGFVYVLTGTYYQSITLFDADDVQVNPLLYVADLVAGSVTFDVGADLTAYTQPFSAAKRKEDSRLVTDVDYLTNQVTLGRPLSQDFLAADTFVSSALIFGDLEVKVINFFDQQTWTDVWSDVVIGSNSIATYNHVANPVILTNGGTINQRWALIFTSSTTFNIVGETVGLIGTGQTNGAPGTFISPLNINNGYAYWELATEGFGAGYSTGNVIRFETVSLSSHIWFIRVTQQGDDTQALTDQFTVQIRGGLS